MSCGHLRVYHAKGLPEGVYELRNGECLFCEIEDLRAALIEIRDMPPEEDEWDAVAKYGNCQGIARECLADEGKPDSWDANGRPV